MKTNAKISWAKQPTRNDIQHIPQIGPLNNTRKYNLKVEACLPKIYEQCYNCKTTNPTIQDRWQSNTSCRALNESNKNNKNANKILNTN
jgi:hypothetical protein